MSIAVENFVKAVYQYSVLEHTDTKSSSIAKKLNISNAAATDMAKKLAAKRLLNYEKYKALTLTEEGTKMALKVIRKHRLWEAFLYEVFDMTLHDIHREAELLEHQTSDFMAEKLNQYLGHPEFDPHGDPIPDALGSFSTTRADLIILTDAKAEQSYTIAQVLSNDKDFCEFCLANDLNYGDKITVDKQFAATQMTQVTTRTNTLILNNDFTKLLLLQNETNQ